VKDLLAIDPEVGLATDAHGNTVFHYWAQRAKGTPADDEVLQVLLRACWLVVDSKNGEGKRADVVAQNRSDGAGAERLLARRSVDYVEPTREQHPLPLVSDTGCTWERLLVDNQRRSFSSVKRGAFSQQKLDRWAKATMDNVQWLEFEGEPRKAAWFVAPGFEDCPYRYSGKEWPAAVFPPWLDEIRREVSKVCGLTAGFTSLPNSCNLNLYSDGTQEVGWHADDELFFGAVENDALIVSFSLGTARDFTWRYQGTTEPLGSVSLGDGDIATMEGLFQKHYKHAVLKVDDPNVGWRLNFTFRWIVNKAHARDALVKAAQ